MTLCWTATHAFKMSASFGMYLEMLSYAWAMRMTLGILGVWTDAKAKIRVKECGVGTHRQADRQTDAWWYFDLFLDQRHLCWTGQMENLLSNFKTIKNHLSARKWKMRNWSDLRNQLSAPHTPETQPSKSSYSTQHAPDLSFMLHLFFTELWMWRWSQNNFGHFCCILIRHSVNVKLEQQRQRQELLDPTET